MLLSYLFWDPAREMFTFSLPFLNRPILWYGFFFAFGFFLGYWVLLFLLRDLIEDKTKLRKVADRIVLYVVLGTVVGARLGDLLFYQTPSSYLQDPTQIIRVWMGGLASHGGAIGILLALYILSRRKKKELPTFRWLTLTDLVVIPTALAGCLIRIGNFFNQEILGTPTTLPWAIVFGHPADGSAPIPRHPVQLYESLYYLLVFVLLFSLWRATSSWKKPGKITGLFLLLIFGFRFLIEFLKEEQSLLLPDSFLLTMGQLLSLPFILLGAYLLLKRMKAEG